MIIPPIALAIYSLLPKPCCNQFWFWKHRLIYKQESTHIMLLHLFRVSRETAWTRVWLTERRGSERGRWRVGGVYCTSWRQQTHRQTSYLAVQWVSTTALSLSLHANHISSCFSRLTWMITLVTYTPRASLHAECRQTKKIKSIIIN